jgi:hypothetical protein
MESDFACQTTLGQQLERAIDRSHADLRVTLFDQSMKLIDRKVFACFHERAQDSVALLSVLQANAFQVRVEALLGIAQGLTRDAWLVIDSIMQHAAGFILPNPD